MIKRTIDMTESAFSHALKTLVEKGLVEARKVGREKIARLSKKGQIVFASLQALCFTLGNSDGTSVEDDSAMVAILKELGV